MPANPQPPDRSRRAFLRGRSRPVPSPVRPPWTDETRLARACTRCEACIEACPEGILFNGEGGYPAVNFRQGAGACTFCAACAEACPEPVFAETGTAPWRLSVTIDSGACLAHRGVHCETCRDACEPAAIRFAPRIGGPSTPIVNTDRCNGCGACAGVCPAEAVRITPGEALR
ncbi:MAG: ferredoxin-type protein NapF [Rhizobiales bacterium NRL2]|jgi:ferredoxin-type protein NapF|nr:MAG: ferredoxin-type protein NapF [Rhizobiales bacterium NRL2]